MVKKRVFLAAAMAALVLTSCQSAASDDGQTTSAKKTQSGEKQTAESFEEAYDRIEETDTHFELDLNENVHVDADVTWNMADTAGIYDYTVISGIGEPFIKDTADILNRLNTYYGTEMLKEKDLRNSVNGFSFSLEEKLFNVGQLESLYYRLPDSRMEEDQELKEQTDKVLDIFKDAFAFSIDTEYEYSHLTETVYTEAGQSGGKIDLSPLGQEEYYCVTVRPAPDLNIPVLALDIMPEVQDGQRFPDNIISRDGSIWIYEPTFCSMVFDKDKNLILCEIHQGIEMEQAPVQQVNILSGKSMLEVLHEHYKTISRKTEILDLKLCYAAWNNGTDENGIEKYQLIPVWQVCTAAEKTGYTQKEFYNAITGAYIGYN